MKRFAASSETPGLVLGHPLFKGLPQELAAVLLRDAATLHIQAGEILFNEGDDAIEYLYLYKGHVEVLRHTREGQERVFHIFHAGQLLAETAMFMSHGRYPMQARARDDSVVFCLKRRGLLSVCEAWPQLSLRLLSRLSDQVYHRINEVQWFSDSTAAQRLASYLLRLSAATGEARHLPMTQRQLATHLGIRAETLSRLLADWVAQGRVSGSRRRWVLLDQPYLESLARSAERHF